MIGIKLANRYETLREIGRGGMGVVYLARDLALEREVAIKLITPSLLSADNVERFKREARLVAQMDHPAVIPVHDVGEHEGSLFFVMPFVRGENLRSMMQGSALHLGDVVDIGIKVAEALGYSHAQGVVHRDIKPENILVMREEEGLRVRITDFGLAMASSRDRITKTGAVVGTIAYLSPEQVSAEEMDGRSDIYSLGTVLYECLVGDTPFTGDMLSVLYRIVHENPAAPRSLGMDIPEELESIVMQCLEKDSAMRPQRSKEVAEALAHCRLMLEETDLIRIVPLSSKDTTIQYQKGKPHPFVGREEELQELQRRLNAVLAGECQFAVVGGEAGVGKSRLLDELEKLARARKIRVLHGRFVEQDKALPYHGFCEVIQEYFRSKEKTASSSSADFSDLAPDLVSLFPVLAEIKEISSGTSSTTFVAERRKLEDRTHIFELLARSLIRIVAGEPLVILLEDLHAADVSLEALQYIVRRMGPTPTLIVGAYRTTEVDKWHPLVRVLDSYQGDSRFVSIIIGTFSPSEHRAFLKAFTGRPEIGDAFADRLYEATDGNPYFTKELILSLIDSGGIIQQELSIESNLSKLLPATIQQAVEKRIDRLPDDLQRVLSIASILGKSFEFRDMEALLEDKEDFEDALDQLIEGGFIEEEIGSRGDRFVFSSGVVRDVLYGKITRRKRKSLHRKHAESLEKRNSGRLERVYPQLLHHYRNGGVSEKVIEYGLKLARKSLDAFSPEEALRAAGMVLPLLEEQPAGTGLPEGEARILSGQALRMIGNMEGALKEIKEAIRIYEEAERPSEAVRGILLAAETAWEGRKVEETKQWVDKGLSLARAMQEIGVLVRLLSLGATVANLRCDYEKAKEYLDEMEGLQPADREREEEIPKGGTLVVARTSAMETKHPVNIQLDDDVEIFANVFETLVTADSQGRLVRGLCEKWEVADRGRSFVLTLRPDVCMHDGQRLTAKDVKTSFEKAIQLSSKSLPAAFAAIQGVSEFLEGRADHVSGIVIFSEEQLRIQLQEPLRIYPALLTDVRTAIVRESEGQILGTGPFRIASLTPDCVVLERNSDYWKSTPSLLDAVEFRALPAAAQVAEGFRSGEIDLAADLLPQDLEEILRNRRLHAEMVEAPKKNVYFVLFNRFSPAAQDPVLRQVLCGVLRTHDLVRRTLGRFAEPAEGLLPPGILGHDPGRRRQPLTHEKTAELLESMQLPLRLKASVHGIFHDRYASLVQAVLRTWSEIGIRIAIETSDMASYLQTIEKNEGIDLLIGRWVADYDDPDNFTYGVFHSKAGLFRNYFYSEEMDSIMDKARMESDPETREKLYRKLETLLLENNFFLPLFHENNFRVAGWKVRGLTLRSAAPYVNYREVGKTEVAVAPAGRKTRGGAIHVPISREIRSLDPSLSFHTLEAEALSCIFENLTTEAEGARVIPWLAYECRAEEGGRRFRFRLREDVRFHDGRRITARDVRYTFERVLQNRESQSRGWFLAPVRGAEELLTGRAEHLEGFRILSASEFVIDLNQPISFFPALLVSQTLGIVPEGSEHLQGDWRSGLVGTGPFRVLQFDPGERLRLEANPYYWRKGYPKCDGLVFTFGVTPAEIASGFRSGKFSLAWDLLPSDVDALRHESESAPRYFDVPSLSTYYVVFNVHEGPLSDKRLRKNLVESVNVEGVVRRHLGRLGIPAYGLIPPGLLGYEPSSRSVPATSQTRHSSQPVDLKCMIHSVFDGPYSTLADELLRLFREAGFRVQIQETRSDYPNALVSAEVDLIISRWFGDYPDADTFANGLLHSEKGQMGRFCGTPEIDRLIEKGRSETDAEMRHLIYREIEEIISREALLLPLFYEQTYRFARPEVEGFDAGFAPPFVAYDKLWILS